MPETFITAAKDWWAVVGGFAGIILWFARLEGRGRRNSEDLRDYKNAMKEQRAEDLANRQRDWDAMNGRLDSIQSDIKELLKRR